ncbi:MAG: S1/P1 nuclease [Bacteroidetes bacterium]|nr:S1/P1 nuclease [Bacteroidota bacterium]MBS1939408.1 S1/P1 nuclease [Bacteroidota bacterium]
MKLLRFLPLFLLFQPAHVFAWGATGHRVVGAIAEQHLSKKARKAVHRILGSESMAMAATWMDDIKSDHSYDYMRDWHWVTIPDGSTYAAAEKNPHGDAVEAIGRMVAALKSDTLSAERQTFCLKVLIHLIGDLHQPLHVGRGDDKGGNDFQVRWFKQGSNLHRVWDSGMIDHSQLSYTELACAVDHATPEQIKQWSQGTAADWAQENLAFRQAIYPDAPGAELGYDYNFKNWPTVEEQLLKAGIRLSGVLNSVFR